MKHTIVLKLKNGLHKVLAWEVNGSIFSCLQLLALSLCVALLA